MIPKLEFKVAPFKHIFDSINYFLNSPDRNWDWSGYILNRYPKLQTKLQDIKNIEERKKIIEDFFDYYYKKNKDKLEKNAKLFQNAWDTLNDKYMKALSRVLEIGWPDKDKKIQVYVGLNPICPRYIKERAFDIYYEDSNERVIAIAIHEILHFLYFEKWKETFPETKDEEFNEPHLVWKLSEMVPRTILSDERIQKVFKHRPDVYDEYIGARIKGKPLLDYFRKFYHEKKDMQDFLKKSWRFINEYKEEINKI